MNLHSERHPNAIHNLMDSESGSIEEDHHHKLHETLKEVFNKHGVPMSSDFVSDLKSWKHS